MGWAVEAYRDPIGIYGGFPQGFAVLSYPSNPCSRRVCKLLGGVVAPGRVAETGDHSKRALILLLKNDQWSFVSEREGENARKPGLGLGGLLQSAGCPLAKKKSTGSWSSIQLQESAKSNPSQSATKQAKKTPRVLRNFAQARIQDKYQRQVSCTKVSDNDIFSGQTLVPGMSLYEFSQVSDAESQAVGDEEPMIFDS